MCTYVDMCVHIHVCLHNDMVSEESDGDQHTCVYTYIHTYIDVCTKYTFIP